MVDKKQPDYKLAEAVDPMDRVFAIYKVLSLQEVQTTKVLLQIFKVADKTGTLNLVLKDTQHIEVCKALGYIEVLNAQAKVYKGFIQLEMDRWGTIRPCSNEALIDQYVNPPNTENDLSKVEYEVI